MSSVKRATSVALDLDHEGKIDGGIAQDIIIPEHDGTPFFEAGDGDLQLWVGEECFETHRYLIKRFKGLKGLLRTHATTTTLHVPTGLGGHSSVDFHRTLEVLYASVLEGPFEFDSSILVSALRIATVFDYPALRTYTIKHLERAQLSAIERIKIAREFDLPSWEEPAYLELCGRDDAITTEEASVLGMDAFVRVAGIREREQRRRGRELDVKQLQDGAEGLGPVGSTSGAEGGDGAVGGEHITCETPASTKAGDAPTETHRINFSPSFADTPPGHDIAHGIWTSSLNLYHIPIAGCKCQILGRSGGLYDQQTCGITPCAAMAFKELQTQQVAQTDIIARLQSSLNELTVTSSPATSSGTPPGADTCVSIREGVRGMILALQAPPSQA